MTYCVESDHEMAVVASKDNSILFAAISKDTVFFATLLLRMKLLFFLLQMVKVLVSYQEEVWTILLIRSSSFLEDYSIFKAMYLANYLTGEILAKVYVRHLCQNSKRNFEQNKSTALLFSVFCGI